MDDYLSRTVGSLAEYAQLLCDSIWRDPHVVGAADIFLVDYDTSAARAGTLIGTLFGIGDEDGRRVIQRYLVVAAPGNDVGDLSAAIWDAVRDTVEALGGGAIPENAATWLRSRIDVQLAADLRTSSLLPMIREQPERTAVIVLEAARYRDDSIRPFIPVGAATPLRAEDLWAPQLERLAREATEVAAAERKYVAIDASELTPTRPELIDLLMSIDRCGVIGASDHEGLGNILAEHVDQWETWISAGRLGRALQDIDALPPVLNGQKSFLRIQLLYKAGLVAQALEAVRSELLHRRALDASARVKLARIALDAGANNLSRELLTPAVDTLVSQEDLESALATATDLGAAELEGRISIRLALLFPDSPGLRERQRRELSAVRDFAGLARSTDDPRQVAIYDALDRYLSGDGVPDYATLLAAGDGSDEVGDVLRMAAVDDALRRRLYAQAFQLVMPPALSPRWSRARNRRLLEVLKELFLNVDRDEELLVGIEEVQAALLSLVMSLANDPDDRLLRVGLTSLLHPSVAGTRGFALLAWLAVNAPARGLVLEKRASLGNERADWLVENKPCLVPLFKWLKSEEPVIIGRTELPSSLLAESADKIVSAIADYLEIAPVATYDDVLALHNWLAVGAAVARHSSDADFDLRLVRLASGKLASSTFAQPARDLVEQALQNGNDTPRRRRLSWFAMADVYHRTGNILEALIALSCAYLCDDRADEEQAAQEAILLARLTRDIGLIDVARRAVVSARKILAGMGLTESNGHRLDVLDLQIQLRALDSEQDRSEGLRELLDQAVLVGRAVLSQHSETEPIGSTLGQLIRKAREAGVTVPEPSVALLQELMESARGRLAAVLRSASVTPTAQDLLEVLNGAASARYSDDVGFDARNVALLASRAIGDDGYLSDADDTSFALELLADRGVAIPGWDEAAVPPSAPASTRDPGEIARRISKEGISIVQAGWDDQGRLVRLDAIDGALGTPTRESTDIMEEQRFRDWVEEYPYAYGNADDGASNLFYTTTQKLRFSSLPKGPVVLVADVAFQAFPPNLLYVDDTFAGRRQPMAAAPSLAWLAEAESKGAIGDGRRCAWISTADSGGATLGMIAQRLEPTFTEHGFDVDNSAVIPSSLSGASMVVVTAHGGVHPEGRYFHTVSDEGVLRVSAEDLALALRNVGVVILFVCSAGRSDKHPVASTTLGLAKRILDRGSTAVLASPWPLDARVPSHWLPAFLEHWRAGAPLVEANFAANAVVDEAFSLDPARGLAMTLFGNPMLRFSI